MYYYVFNRFMLSFVQSSVSAGNIKVMSKVWGREVIITPQGTWIPEDDAEEITEQEYKTWCPKEKRFVLKRAIFIITPSARQLENRPEE